MAGSFGPVQRVPKVKTTYWGPGVTGSDGEPSLQQGILIDGRWVAKRTEVQSASGEQYVSSTMVIVDVDLEEGGYLMQGDHTATTPFVVEGAQQIQGWSSTPDLRYMEQVRRAFL